MATPPIGHAPGAGGFDRKDFVAVEMKNDHAYLSNDPRRPPHTHDLVPENFRDKENYVPLKKGEQGWRTSQDPHGVWSQCLFEREGKMYTFLVPSDVLKVGERFGNFRALDRQVVRDLHLQLPQTPTGGSTALNRFIRTFWGLAKNHRSHMRTLGLSVERDEALFNDASFQTNVETIVNAFTPAAALLLASPNPATFAKNLLRGLEPVTQNTPDGSVIYLRLYTMLNQGVVEDPAAYGGISREVARRKVSHELATEKSDSWHYSIARRYPAERRFMGLVMDLRNFGNEDLRAMAEQTVISLFDCYGAHQLAERGTGDEEEPWYRSAQQAVLLTKLARRAFVLSGFPRLGWAGCNVQSPLFTGGPAGRAWVRRSIPATPFAPEMYRYSTAVVPTVANGNEMKIWLARDVNIFLFRKAIEEAKLRGGQSVNVVIDITKDRRRHPRPYIRVPDIALYANFSWASSMAVYLEVYDASAQAWTRVQCFRRVIWGTRDNGVYKPYGYMAAMSIIQLLEGIRWNATNQDFPHKELPVRSMEYARYNHLAQTIQWVDVLHPRSRLDLPHKMTYAENADRLFATLPGVTIGPEETPWPQVTHPRWPDRHDWSQNRPRISCDACWWKKRVAGEGRHKCEGGSECCTTCKEAFNRPCSWTDKWRLNDWAEDNEPLNLFYNCSGRMVGADDEVRRFEVRRHICRRIVEPFGGQALLQALAAAGSPDDEMDSYTDAVEEAAEAAPVTEEIDEEEEQW